MSERNLTRRLAVHIVDALKAQGHILVVKGGTTPLVRELDERMSKHVEQIAPQIVPRAAVGGEVTSTFGNEAVDDAVEEMVSELTRTLMDSDHVEDVFAEDNVIQRDIFRVAREVLLHREDVEGDDEDELPIRVRLDTLGYVASTVGKLADTAMLRDALERAADAVEATLTAYNAPTREALFLLEGGGPDRRLELEEAVADELSDLADDGLVELPTIERRIELDRDTTSRERTAARARVELAAVKTIMRSGCAAAWEFVDPRTIKVTFTPLSDQDALDVDPYIPMFERELAALFPSLSDGQPTEATRAPERAEETAASAPEPTPEPAKKPRAAKAAPPPASEPDAAPRPKARSRAASESATSATKKTAAKRSSAAAAETPAKRSKAAAEAPKATRTRAAAPSTKKVKSTAKKR